MFYRWQKEFFEHGAAAFQSQGRRNHPTEQQRIEFPSRVVDQWAYRNQVALHFIERGKPTQNALIESFKREVPR